MSGQLCRESFTIRIGFGTGSRSSGSSSLARRDDTANLVSGLPRLRLSLKITSTQFDASIESLCFSASRILSGLFSRSAVRGLLSRRFVRHRADAADFV